MLRVVGAVVPAGDAQGLQVKAGGQRHGLLLTGGRAIVASLCKADGWVRERVWGQTPHPWHSELSKPWSHHSQQPPASPPAAHAAGPDPCPGSHPGFCSLRSFPPKGLPPTCPAARRTSLRAGQTLNPMSSHFKLRWGDQGQRGHCLIQIRREAHAGPCFPRGAWDASSSLSGHLWPSPLRRHLSPPPPRKRSLQLRAAAGAATSPQYPRPQ